MELDEIIRIATVLYGIIGLVRGKIVFAGGENIYSPATYTRENDGGTFVGVCLFFIIGGLLI